MLNIFIPQMAFKETFETINESEREVQKFLTYLKEHSNESEKRIKEGKYVKAYKQEFGIERRLKLLLDFFEEEKKQAENELREFKQGAASICLGIKCKQIDSKIQNEFAIDEDFGEED
jgi:hypothetical protein